MNDFRFTPQAADDLFEIWSFIVGHDPGAADRKEFTSRPLRFWLVRRFPHYIVVYDPSTEPLQVIRLLHGRRDLPRLLR